MLRRLLPAAVLAAAVAVPFLPPAAAQPAKTAPAASYTRTEDVVYGRKFGLALTMDVFAPKDKPNGRGVVYCVSGGWYSGKQPNISVMYPPLLDRGYTVFAVVHGSQPMFTIPEVLDDMHRAVRYVRAHAQEYGVDPDKLGISGGSAGGHLSLMQGTAFKPGNPKAVDAVDRQSSRVAAVGCFFPPTDFLNYGKDGETALGTGILRNFKAPFDFRELDTATRSFALVTDQAKRKEIGRAISPAYHVTKESAPALVIHGDADTLVPIQQAELIGAKYKEAGVPFELVVKKGAGHGWPDIARDMGLIADWFDKQLK
jgi:acetyl esterase/lipase